MPKEIKMMVMTLCIIFVGLLTSLGLLTLIGEWGAI
jgi:hypothetical protein